jgi:hypothetical protein
MFTVESGLDYDVSISARNAATLRGQFLNTANAAWDLRGNVASQTWNTVVLQEQSDAALPAGRGKKRQPGAVQRLRRPVRALHPQRRRADVHRKPALRQPRRVPGDRRVDGDVQHRPHDPAEPERERGDQGLPHRHLARPDMVFAHKITTPDLTTADGRRSSTRRAAAATRRSTTRRWRR